MQPNKEPNNDQPRKPPFLVIIIALIALMLFFQIFSASQSNNQQTPELAYSEFLLLVSSGNVSEVTIGSTTITFTAMFDGRESRFMTGRVEDPDLVARLERSKVKFTQTIPQQNNLLLTLFLYYGVPILLFVGLSLLMTRMMGKNMGGAFSLGKSNAKVYMEAQTGKTFQDVAGEDEAKAALQEIVDFLHDPGKYKSIGARMPKGALLVGPPGIGKTLLAKAVAGEAKVPFFSISGSEFVEMFVGMGAARVRDLFKQATEKAPCIVFIDEIDAVGKSRDGSGIGGNDEREQTLNQLLAEMDGFDSSKGVVILAATNRPDSLDKALLRPGRFDRRIPVELPDLAGREAILKVHAKDVRVAKDIDWRAIALATSGTSGAELANIINEGALLAVKEGRKEVIQKDLEESIETVIAGYQRKGAVISPKEKKVVSYHEIGHALVAAMQSSSAPVHKITIIPRTSGALGYTMQVDEDEHFLMSREEIFNKITTLTAGRASEELIFSEVTSGAANDIEKATKLARAMVTRLGMSEQFDMTALEVVNNVYLGGDASLACSPATAAKIDQEVMSIIRSAHEKAMQILKEHEAKLHELAAYLLERETITGEEFMRILNDVPKMSEAASGDTQKENDTMTESPLPESCETGPEKTADVSDVPHVRDETSTQENE